MGTLTITCPHCKQQFGIRNNSDKDKIYIKCPHCSKPVTVVLRKTETQTPADSDSGDCGETITGADMMKGTPVLIFNGVSYSLQTGRNTVGRESSSSMSTIQLPSDDRYMSRTNAVIDVKNLSDGTHRVTIGSTNNRNLVKVNGVPVNMGDRTVLLNGYVLTFGNTKIVFSLQQ